MKASDKPIAKELILGLLSYRKTQTMKSIYERITPGQDGRIRTSMNPAGTETSRFSHSETWLERSTNLANLPKKTARNPLYNVRRCLVADVGRTLWKADYNAAEARWCAYIADDEDRIKLYERNVDQYKLFVAALRYNDPEKTDLVSKAERNVIGKVGILSGQYGVQWKTLMETINAESDATGIAVTPKMAKKMVSLWPELFPRTVKWWDEVRHQILSKGYLVNPFGRRRDFFGRMDSDYSEAQVVREAIAFGPQSANADMLNTALVSLFEGPDASGVLRLLLQVHDELVGDCAAKDIDGVAKVVKDHMEFGVVVNGREISIPAEFSAGQNWAEMETFKL